MKKVMMFLALAIVPMFFASCTKSESDVIYSIGVEYTGGSFFGQKTGDAYNLYEEIINELNISKEEWKDRVTNGKYDATDSKAIAKYNTVEEQIKAKEATLRAKLDALQDKSFMFTIKRKLYLRKIAPNGIDTYLKEYDMEFTNISSTQE